MSDRGSQIFTLEQRMHDVRAILDEVGSERAVLFGVSEGGPMSLLYAATYPERTSALILYGCYARACWAPDYPLGWYKEQWQRFAENCVRNRGHTARNWPRNIGAEPCPGSDWAMEGRRCEA
jgi:pimeloyl-ACP methyl ester carboxylesterase